MRILFFLLIACLLGTACSKKRLCGCVPPPGPAFFKATVVQTNDLDCGKPVISFDPSDTAVVFQILGKQHVNLFLVKELSPALNVVGQKLYVLMNKLTPDEEFICTTMGPVYDHIKLLSVEKRD